MISASVLRSWLAGWELSLAVAGLATPAAAQQVSRAAATDPLSAPQIVAVSRPVVDSLGDNELRMRAIVATGAPRSYQVVSIAVPASVAGRSGVRVEISPLGEFAVLGARTRLLDSTANLNARIVVTIGIPTKALAGRLLAAEARFTAPASPTIVVPIEIDVSLVRDIRLKPGSATHTGQAGGEIIVPFEVVNSGNSREVLAEEFELPEGWAIRDLGPGSITIDPGQSLKRRVRLAIPARSPTGSSFLRLGLRSSNGLLTSETVTIEVHNAASFGRESGPIIVSGVSHATDEKGMANNLLTMTVTGALFDSVRVDARVSQGTALGAAASNAFVHLGSYQSSASASLVAPDWQLSLGSTGTSFSNLTGLYPYGQGALLNFEKPAWSLMGFAARSIAGPQLGKPDLMLGGRAGRAFGDVRLSSSISHIGDGAASPRHLDAVGVGATVPIIGGSTLKLEVAERRFQSGSGFGWSSELIRVNGEHNELLRMTHAPGGSDAFARAVDEITASVSERITARASVSASAWRTTDATSVFSSLTSNGASLRPQFEIRSGTTLALEARSYLFDATSRLGAGSPGGAFSTRESQLGISVSTNVGQYYANTSAFLGTVNRTVSPSAQIVLTDRTPRNYWATNAGWFGVGGNVEVQTRVEQTRDRAGFVNQQSIVGIRADQVVIPGLGGVKGESELQRVYGFGRDRSEAIRVGIAIPVVSGFAFHLGVERNSIFRAPSGRVPWIFGARFEHTMTLPMLRSPGTTGHVYKDLNGNQRRDPGELGAAGVLVRRGGESAITDGDGSYRIGGDSRVQIAIDEASLPDGWSASGGSGKDLALALSTSAVVELVIAARGGIYDVKVDLSKARVIARDSTGREWIARMTGPTTAAFESLPVGRYQLDFDLSELAEPLAARAPVPDLLVTGKESNAVTVTLDPRPVRMWKQATPQSGSQPKITDPTRDKANPNSTRERS